MSFLFLESTETSRQEAEIADSLEQLFEAAAEQEEGDLGAKKTPLAKALSTFGIESADLQLDPEGFCIVTDNREKYMNIVAILSTTDAMHKLAEMGWVVTKPGDVAMTGEPAEYRIRFLEIATVETSDSDSDSPDETLKAIAKKAQAFTSTAMDRDDELNPVENGDDEMGDNQEGVGKATSGEQPKGKLKEEINTDKRYDDIGIGQYNYMGLEERFPLHVQKAKEFLAAGDIFNAQQHALTALHIGASGHIGTPLYLEAKEVLRQVGHPVPEAMIDGDISATESLQQLDEMTGAGDIPPLEQGAKGDGLETKGRGGKLGRKFKMPGNYKLRQPYATPKKQVSEGYSTRRADQAEAFATIRKHNLTPVSWAADVNPAGFIKKATYFEISDEDTPTVIARLYDPRGPKGPYKGWVEYGFTGQVQTGGQMAEGLGASAGKGAPNPAMAQEMNAQAFLEAPLPENEGNQVANESATDSSTATILEQTAEELINKENV